MATFTGADKAIGFLFDMVANIADDYESSSTYALDAYAIYEGTLYKCINPISTPEDFTPAHWQAVLIMDEVAAGGGGGGGGTTVIANPAGSATDTLNKLQVGSTIYDVPSGGGSSGHTYSRNEQVVGTWIDGKTLYEKTLDIPAIAANDYTTVAHNVTNFDKFIRIEVFLNDCSFSGDYNRPDNVQKEFYVQTVATGVFVRAYQQAVTSGYAIIQYTKTV